MGMTEADKRRARQAASIGFIPAPAGHSRLAMLQDDERTLERTFRIAEPETAVQAFTTADGVIVVETNQHGSQ